MRDEHHRFNLMVARVRTHLHDPANEPLWLGKIPYLDTRVGEMESAAEALGIFGNQQATPTTGASTQQNAAEKALEDGAFAVGHRLKLYYRQQGNLAKAAEWNVSKTKWRTLPETLLLSKAKTLRTEAQALTTGSPAPGAAFGVTTERVTALGALVDRYDEELGKPGDARSDRKAMTGQLRERYGALREMLEDIDGMIEPMRDDSDAHRVFVDGYFNARRIGGHSSPDAGGANPAPPPPTP